MDLDRLLGLNIKQEYESDDQEEETENFYSTQEQINDNRASSDDISLTESQLSSLPNTQKVDSIVFEYKSKDEHSSSDEENNQSAGLSFEVENTGLDILNPTLPDFPGVCEKEYEHYQTCLHRYIWKKQLAKERKLKRKNNLKRKSDNSEDDQNDDCPDKENRIDLESPTNENAENEDVNDDLTGALA